MGVAPENCTVIEDSPAGITAAKQAGMRVFAFAGGSHAEPAGLLAAFEAMQPDLVFDDMRKLPELLAGGAGETVAGGRGASSPAPSISAPAAPAPASSMRRGNLLGRADYPIVMNRAAARPCRARFRGYLARRLRGDARRAGQCRRQAGRDRRHFLRRHLLAGRARPRRRAARRLDRRRRALGHHRLARPSRARRGRRLHGDRPPRARLSRRRHVAGDADAQADVDQAQPAGRVGTRRPILRPRRFPDLSGVGLQRPLAMHADLQMDLSRA